MKRIWLVLCLLLALPGAAYAAREIEEDSSGYLLIGPFVDDDDFSTLQSGLTISQSDVKLSKNGGASAQKNDATSCSYDANGMYRCPYNSTDSNTAGVLVVTVKEDDTCVVVNTFTVRASNPYDSLIGGTDKLDINVEEWNATSVPAEDTAGYPKVTIKDGTGAGELDTTSGAVDVDGLTASGQAAVEAEATDALEADGLQYLVSEVVAGANVADDSIIAQMVSKSATADWDTYVNTTESHEALRDILGTPAGTFASDIYAIGEDVTDVLADTNELQTNQGNWLTATGFMPDTEDGTSFDAIPWNPDWDAEVESEVNDGLIVNNLDHLCKTATGGADMTTEVADNTILSRVLANGDTSAFDPSTDGFQPIRDRGDAAWITATGFMPDTEDGSSLDSIPWNSSWDTEVQSEANDALVALHLDHLLAADYDPASKPGTATALLNELVENDGGVSRYTENALEQAPTGGATAVEVRTEMDSNSTQLAAIVADTGELQTNQGDWATAVGFSTHSAADSADAVWDELVTGHDDAGKAGAQLWTDLDAVLADTGELQTNQGNWATAVGFSTHSAVNVRTEMDSNSTQLSAIVTDTNELQTNQGDWLTATGFMPDTEDGSSFDSIPWNSDWDTEVESEVYDELVQQHLDHLLAVDTGGSLPGAAGSIWHDLLEDDSGTWRFTANALEQAAGSTDWTSTELQHIRYRLGVDGSTSTPSSNIPHLEVVDADVKQIDDSTTAVSVIKNYYTAGVTQGSVSDAEPTATEFDTTLTAAGNDYYNNAFIVFIDGDLTGQVRKIRDYTAGTPSTITVGTAFTIAPTSGDNFLILGRSE